MSRWLLEHDSEGEVYTRPRTSKKLIQEVLELFNGSTIFYCSLFDTTDESCLWCVGEPVRRIIEGRLFEDDTIFHFVLRKKDVVSGNSEVIRWGMEASEVIRVEPSVVLTAAEAVAVFQRFHQSKTIPDGFEAIAKAYVFGSQSFKD